jgi:hypothetical protein
VSQEFIGVLVEVGKSLRVGECRTMGRVKNASGNERGNPVFFEKSSTQQISNAAQKAGLNKFASSRERSFQVSMRFSP